MWWLIPIAIGFFAATSGGSKPAPVDADDGDDELPPQSVPLWRGVVGRIAWSVAAMPGVAIAWEVRIRFVPASGNMPSVTAQTLSGAEPDVGAAIRAAIRTAIEQGGSAARGVVQGTSDALAFNVQPEAPGWRWAAFERAANPGRSFDGRALTRGAAVLAAVDAIGDLSGP